MTENKQIIIDGFNLEYIKELLYNGQRSAITTKIFEEIIENLELKEQECERLKHDNGYEVGALEKTIDNLKAENKHLNDLLNQALKELEKTRETLTEIKEIAEQQVPYINLDQVKTCTEVEYDYAGKIWYLEQKMYKIIQKCEEVNKQERTKNENLETKTI